MKIYEPQILQRYEVSFPTPKRSRVLMTLGAETICFESHDDSQLPLNGNIFIRIQF